MSQKVEITKCIMQELGIEINHKSLRRYISTWWNSPRKKDKKGFWLSENGFIAFKQASIKSYKITFAEPLLRFDNKFLIWLDNSFDCPFYLTEKEIFVFGERTAVQVMLFSGDLELLYKNNIKHKEKNS